MKFLFMALLSLTLAATSAFAQSSYRIQGGDVISIEVLEDNSLNRSLLVLPDGTVNFPFVGSVRVAGRTSGQVEQAISSGIAGNFATTPTVFVSVSSVTVPEGPAAVLGETMNIFFTGEVNRPGLTLVAPGTTILQAIGQSGGFTRFAATKRVQLRRTGRQSGQPQIFTINYRALANGASLANDIVLREGDVILVPERRLFE